MVGIWILVIVLVIMLSTMCWAIWTGWFDDKKYEGPDEYDNDV